MRTPALIIAVLTLSACASSNSDYRSYLQGRQLPMPTTESLPHCHAYGCQAVSTVALDAGDWKAVQRAMKPKAKTAEQERQRIARAISVFETRAGAKAGTDGDKTGTFTEMGRYQQDCVDESTNTTIYLSAMEQKGLLKFHSLRGPTTRTPFRTGRWPHQSAVIAENGTDTLFAVDSWFHDNGHPAEIVPLEQWKDGWNPDIRHGSFEQQ